MNMNKYIWTVKLPNEGIVFLKWHDSFWADERSLSWSKSLNDASLMSVDEFTERSVGMIYEVKKTVRKINPLQLGILY